MNCPCRAREDRDVATIPGMLHRRLVPVLGAVLSVAVAAGTAGPVYAAKGAPTAEKEAGDAPEQTADGAAEKPADGAAEKRTAAEPDVTDEEVDELAEQVEGLRAEVERTAAELTAGTLRLETGQEHLEQVQARAEAARAAADRALAEVAAARARLAAVVGAAYRQPRPSDMSLAFAAAPGELSAAVLASAELDHVQGNQTTLVLDATAKDERARTLVAEAERLEADAAARTADLEDQVTALRTTAEQTQVRLEEAATRLREAEAAREAARIAALKKKARAKALAAAEARSLADLSGGEALCTTASTAGYPNGFLPPEVLCPLTLGNGHRLRADAAKAFNRMTKAYDLCITDSYRSYGAQVDVYARKPGLAAVPGTSNHGLGVAVDLCGGVQSFGTPEHNWMQKNAPSYGWVHPSWAGADGSRPEPWHWEFVGVPEKNKDAKK